jgi:alkanesulfonate monooxygenase SsuD/methylene tetrahydromethanopterin reductase-like flavin-dependent oxidoreductase (luciferase family)
MEKFWEAHDFILKAMTSHDGPFNWEGQFFHYRNVNIWPRPWQQPHPPIWSAAGSLGNARMLGERGYVMAVLGSGYKTRPLYDAYREGYVSQGRPPPGPDRLAYLGLVAVAASEVEARRRGEQVAEYLRSGGIVWPPFRNPPGYLSVEENAGILMGRPRERTLTRDGRVVDMRSASIQDLIDAAILFCGTPDQVHAQIAAFADYAGGLGHLLSMGQAGFLSHADTVDSMTLFGKEVLPRLKAPQPVASS